MGLVDGALNESCLADLRDALCRVHVDVAFITDHPDYAAEHAFSDLLLRRDGDQPIEVDGTTVGNRIVCSDGHTVDWMFGVEDVDSFEGLRMQESVFGSAAIGSPDDWVFRYVHVTDAQGRSVLGSYLTAALTKADMLSE